MATVSKGRTFVSGETVTPTKLNELVDNATVTSIVDADISASAAVAGTKVVPNFGSQNVLTSGTGDFKTSSGGGFAVRVRSVDANNNGAIQFTNNSASAQWALISSPAQNVVTFSDGGSVERLRIASNGSVGIGKANPSTALDVAGVVTATSFSGPLSGTATGLAAKVTFPNYAGGVTQNYTQTYQASTDGYLSVLATGSFRNGIQVVVGTTSTPTAVVWHAGDDINSNIKYAGSGLIPIPKDIYYRVQPISGVDAFETVVVSWYPAIS